MKKVAFNKIIIVLLAIAGLFTSCKKLVDIPPNPPNEVTSAEQFIDSTNTMSAIAGVYAYKFGLGFGYNDAALTISTSLSADDIAPTNSNSGVAQFYSYTLVPLNTTISSLWDGPYKGIYEVNAVLTGVTTSTTLSPSFKKQITGEMKLLRAFYYFNHVNLFGDVPLVTSTDYQVNDRLPRSPVNAVYTQILADLSDATKDLTPSYPSAGRQRPNLYTALTLLAKVHLYQNNWQAAYNEADSVIQSGLYSLNPDLKSVFLDGSNEAIWQIPAKNTFYATTEANSFIAQNGTVPGLILTPFLLNIFEPGDNRLQAWVGTSTVGSQTYYYPYKYKNQYSFQSPLEDYMIFRFAEVYLIAAEAAAHLGKMTEALAHINIIRARAGLAASNANPSSGSAVLNAVMLERQREYFCEWGNRWFDLKRTGTAGPVLSAEKNGWKPNAALYPLPQAELTLNNQLVQNPGY